MERRWPTWTMLFSPTSYTTSLARLASGQADVMVSLRTHPYQKCC